MSTTIDERVVEMRFDANQFNNNIDTSIQSINKLNSSIDNMSSGKGLLNLGKAAEKVDFSKVEWAATHAGFHIEDVFEKATRFLENNIARRLVDWGTNIGKSLTIEPVFTGFNEYEQKMGSVQTIMNGANVTLEETMNTLEELNTYADKTIYSFGDMTNSIGKFVNAGVKLDDAVMAIKGISNEAAVSGANATEAGRAMYNIAQALSTGSMKLIDWKSIENANMATMEFKKTLIETGIELNSIRAGDTSSLTAEELIADPSKFRASIEGVKGQTWVTDKVMIEALKKYADETTELGKKAYAAAQDVKTFTMLMDTLKEAAQSGWAVSMENVLGNFDEAKAMWTAVNNEIGGLLDKSSDERNKLLAEWKGEGRQALLNSIANIWFTLKDSISAVKDVFQDVFPPMTADRLVNITKTFENFTGKVRAFMSDASTINVIENTFRGIFNVLKGGGSILSSFYSSAKVVFGYMTNAFSKVFNVGDSAKFESTLSNIGKSLTEAGQKVKEFFEDSKNGQNIVKIFQGIFSAIDLVRKGIVTLGSIASSVLSPLLGGAGGIGSAILSIVGAIGDFVTSLNNGASAIDSLSGITEGIKNLGTTIVDSIKNIGLFETIFSGIVTTINKLKEAVTGIEFGNFKLPNIEFSKMFNVGPVLNTLKIIFDTIKNTFDSLSKNIKSNDVLKPLFDLYSGMSKVLNGILGVASSLLNAIKSIFDGFSNMMNTAPFLTISMLFNNILNIINLLNVGFAAGSITQTFQKLAGVLDNFGDAFEGWLDESLAKAAKNFAISIAIVAAALVVLSTVKPERLVVAVAALTAIAYGLRRAITGLSGIKFEGIDTLKKSFTQLSNFGSLTTNIIKFAAALLIVALAIRSIGDLDIANLVASTFAIIVVSQALVKVAKSLVDLASKLNALQSKNLKTIGLSLLEFSIGIRILASAIKVIGEMKLGDIVAGLIAIGISMEGLIYVAKSLEKIKSDTILKTAFALITFSIAVRLIASAVSAVGQLSFEGVVAGLIGITVILSELIIAARMLGESQASTKAAAVLLALAVSIGILGNAISKFGTMSEDQLTQGMYAIVVAVGAMLGIARLLPEEFNKSAIAMLACAIALNIVANAAEKFSNMKFTDMLQGLLGLAAGMAVMAVGLRFMQGSIGGAIAMIIVSAGLVIFAQALKMVGELSLFGIAKGIIGIAAGLIILAAAMAVMSALIPGAIALLVASVGLIAISAALMMLSAIPFTSLLGALIGLAAAIGIFAAASLLCIPLLIPMAALAVVLMLLAGSVAIVGAGLYLIAEAIAVLSTNGIAGVVLLKELAIILLEMIPISLLASIGILALSVSLVALTVALVAFGASLIIVGAALAIVGVGLLVLAAGLTAIAVAAILCSAAFAAITGNLDGLSDVLGSFSGDFISAGKQLMSSFIDGIKSMAGKAWSALKDVGSSITSKFKSFFGVDEDNNCQEAYDSGKAIGDSYKQGLEDSKPEAEKSSSDFGAGLLDEFKSSVGVDKVDPKSLFGEDIGIGDLSSGTNSSDLTSSVSGLNGELLDTKNLTGDSALNMEDVLKGTTDTNSIMGQLGDGSSELASNTGDAADNMEKISNVDVSNVEALNDANLDGLTNEKTITDLDKTKDSIDAITDATEKSNEETLKVNVDDSEIRKIADEIEKGLYGNGEERWIKLGAKFDAKTIAEAQNLVNQDFGVSKRHNPDEFKKYTNLAFSKDVYNEEQSRYLDYVNSVRERYMVGSIPTSVAEDIQKQKLLFKKDAILNNKNLDQKEIDEIIKEVDTELNKIEELKKGANEVTIHYTGKETAEDIENKIQKYKELGKEVQLIFDKIPSDKTAKNLLHVDAIPSSEKDKMLEIISEEQKLTNLWNRTIQERHLSMTKGLPTSYRKDDEHDYAGSTGAKNADDSSVRNNQKARLAEFQERINNRELVDSVKKVEKQVEKTGNQIEKSTKSPEQLVRELGRLNPKAYYSSVEDTNDVGARDADNPDVRKNQQKRLAAFKEAIKSYENSTVMDNYNSDLLEELREIEQRTDETLKKKEAGNKALEQVLKSKSQFMGYDNTSDIESALAAKLDDGFKDVAKNSAKSGFKSLINKWKEDSEPIEVPVKTNANEATKQVNVLNEASNKTKDKKITITADTKSATKAVTEFSNGIKRMSASVDVEASKTRQSFTRFYASLQQIINNYTPMIVANFKQTFKQAVDQTVNFMRSSSVIDQFRSIGENIGKGLAEGIRSQTATVRIAARQLSNAAVNASKSTLKVKSPSEEFIAIGEFCGIGMAEGFKSSMGIVEEASKDLGASSINSIMNEMKQLNLDGIDTTPSIKPILDMGDVESKSGIIEAILNQQKAAKISSDIDNGDKQQRVQDQQMTEQLMIMNSRLEELTKNLESQEPTPVDVNVELQGDARTFFTVMRNQNKDYYRRTGKYAFQ